MRASRTSLQAISRLFVSTYHAGMALDVVKTRDFNEARVRHKEEVLDFSLPCNHLLKKRLLQLAKVVVKKLATGELNDVIALGTGENTLWALILSQCLHRGSDELV